MSIRRYIFLVVLGIFLGLMVPALLGGKESARQLLSLPAEAVTALLLLMLILWCVNTYRIRLLLSGQHSLPGFLTTLRLYLAIEFSSKSTPLGVAAPVAAVTFFKRYGVTSTRTLAVFTATTLLDVFALLLLLTACVLVAGVQAGTTLRLLLLLLGGSLIFLLTGLAVLYLAYRRVIIACKTALTCMKVRQHIIKRAIRALLNYRGAVRRLLALPTGTLAAAAASSLAYWAMHLSSLTVCVWALGGSLDWFVSVVIQITALTGGQLLMMPGGSGGTEAFSALLLSPLLGAPLTAAVILLWRAVMFYLYLLVGGICMLLSVRRPTGSA